jgi:capsular polysaccharide biosynthesis protein
MSAVDTELGGLWRCTIGFALLLFSQIPWPDSGPSGFSERSVIFSPPRVSFTRKNELRMEQQGYLRTFRERWVAVVLGVLVGLGIAAAVGSSIPPTYTATSTLFLSVRSDIGTLNERSQFALARISSYPELAYSSDVLSKTISDLSLSQSVQQLSKSITVSNPATTVLIQVSADASSPKLAAAIANSVSSNLSDDVDQLENSSADSRYTVNLELRNRALEPTSASAPQMTIILGLGLLGGAAIGLIAAIIWARLDSGIRSAGQVRRLSGLPVVGELPALAGPFSKGKRRLERAESSFREAQLTIRQANAAVMPDFLVLLPASNSARAAGVRTGLARAFAATGRSVVLLESEFATTMPGNPGLAEVLSGVSDVAETIRPIEGEQYNTIGAGDPENVPKEYEAEQRIRGAVRAIVAGWDVALVQVTSTTRPVSLELVAPYADGVVVLVRYARSREQDLSHVLSRLRIMGIRPLGIIMTEVPSYRRSDLAAGWLPGDFNEEPRSPVISREEPVTAAVVSPPAKRRPRARRPASVATAPAPAPAPETLDIKPHGEIKPGGSRRKVVALSSPDPDELLQLHPDTAVIDFGEEDAHEASTVR